MPPYKLRSHGVAHHHSTSVESSPISTTRKPSISQDPATNLVLLLYTTVADCAGFSVRLPEPPRSCRSSAS